MTKKIIYILAGLIILSECFYAGYLYKKPIIEKDLEIRTRTKTQIEVVERCTKITKENTDTIVYPQAKPHCLKNPATNDFLIIESPVKNATVSSPIKITGQAMAYEGTFQAQIKDCSGNVLNKTIVSI